MRGKKLNAEIFLCRRGKKIQRKWRNAAMKTFEYPSVSVTNHFPSISDDDYNKSEHKKQNVLYNRGKY